MKLFDPTSTPVQRDALALPPRPASLRGVRLGLVDNTKINSDTLLGKLAERLARRHGAVVSVITRKRSPSHAVDEAAIEQLRRRADLAVSGIGD